MNCIIQTFKARKLAKAFKLGLIIINEYSKTCTYNHFEISKKITVYCTSRNWFEY